MTRNGEGEGSEEARKHRRDEGESEKGQGKSVEAGADDVIFDADEFGLAWNGPRSCSLLFAVSRKSTVPCQGCYDAIPHKVDENDGLHGQGVP